MRYATLMLLALLAAAPAAAQEVYRWVDERGVTHYSDKPREGAERVTVTPPQSYAPTPVPAPHQVPRAGAGGPVYTAVRIASPEQDAVVWGLATEVPVTVATQPQLDASVGHRIQVLLNGVPVGSPAADGSSVVLSGLTPGPQVLKAVIVDAGGGTLLESAPITFHLRLHSIQNPQRRR